MTFAPTGAIAAALTTSLPEEIGGARNWDYRFSWLRDSCFALYALGALGYGGEAERYVAYLTQCVHLTLPDIQVMYGLQRERFLPERELDHLEGYRGSRPVRTGNAAFRQRQIDAYGLALDLILLYEALGGRLDQTLANLLIVAQRDWPVPVRVVEGEQVAEVLRGPGSLALHGPAGGTVSAIPLSAAVTGITYTGLEYPLHDATLRFGSTRGVSNVLATSPASIRIDSGILLVIHSREASVR